MCEREREKKRNFKSLHTIPSFPPSEPVLHLLLTASLLANKAWSRSLWRISNITINKGDTHFKFFAFSYFLEEGWSEVVRMKRFSVYNKTKKRKDRCTNLSQLHQSSSWSSAFYMNQWTSCKKIKAVVSRAAHSSLKTKCQLWLSVNIAIDINLQNSGINTWDHNNKVGMFCTQIKIQVF